MTLKAVVFDFDETLYHAGEYPSLVADTHVQISSLIQRKLRLSPEAAMEKLLMYEKKYGTPFAGLLRDYQIPVSEQRYCVDLNCIGQKTVLKKQLDAISEPKFLFTNALSCYFKDALKRMGLASCFDGVISSDDFGKYPKPYPKAFRLLLKKIGCLPTECVLFEDSLRNIKTAKKMGFTTVLCHKSENYDPSVVDFFIGDIDVELTDILNQVRTKLNRLK